MSPWSCEPNPNLILVPCKLLTANCGLPATRGTYICAVDLASGQLTRYRTPISTAINAIAFPTPNRGWAVGDGGTILATDDGGTTWQIQRSGTDRVALMTVSFTAESFPLSTLSQYTSENNLKTAAIHVVVDPANHHQVNAARLRQASSRLGCNICRIVYPASADAHADTIRQLALAIRSLRPNAVVCESPAFRLPDGSFIDPQDLVQTAAEAAADRHRFSDQLFELGLATWRIDRLAIYDAAGMGELKVNGDKFLPSMGQTIEDQTALSASLLGIPISSISEKTLRVKQYSIARNFQGSDLFDGLKQMGRQIPSRNDARTRRGNLHLMQQNVNKRNELKQLIDWKDTSPRSLLVWRQKLNSIILGQDEDLAGVWLAKLAQQYMRTGQWQMAAVTLHQMSTHYPEHPLGSAALLWLAQYHASDEMLADWILANHVAENFEQSDIDLMIDDSQIEPASFQSQAHSFQGGGMNHMVWVPDKIKEEVDNQLSPGGLTQPKIDPLTESLQQASLIITKIRARDPDLARDPLVRFLEAKLVGRIQSSLAAENQFRQLVRTGDPGESIFVAASRELELANQKAEFQGRTCTPVNKRPKLDGSLDDPCWNAIFEKGHAHFFRMTPPGKESEQRTDVVALGF